MNSLSLLTIILLLNISAVTTVCGGMNETTLYYGNITPVNNIYEKVVMPGYTIALGRTYDLTHVSGTTKTYAWWSDWKIQGTTCTPTTIVKTSYIDTNGRINPKNVTLDPNDGWKIGDWFQWDGCYAKPYQKGQTGPSYVPYLADNNLMFHVIYDPHPPTPPPTQEPTQVITTEPPPHTTTIPTNTTITTATTAIVITREERGDIWPWWYYGIGIFLLFLGLRILW